MVKPRLAKSTPIDPRRPASQSVNYRIIA